MLSRRHFLSCNALASLTAVIPGYSTVQLPYGLLKQVDRVETDCLARPYGDPVKLHALASRAVDAARSMGAHYADVRLTRTVSTQSTHAASSSQIEEDRQYLAVGVRVLVQGSWGFAASPYWTAEEMVRLARVAAAQAKENGWEPAQRVELAQTPIANGQWIMPGIDPFTVPIEERSDFMMAWVQSIEEIRVPDVIGQIIHAASLQLHRQERYFASTDGAWTQQTVYETSGRFSIKVSPRRWSKSSRSITVRARELFPQGKGWELLLEHNPRDQVPVLLAQGAELLTLRVKEGMLGRFDAVLDAVTTARLVDATFGIATQLDRALGYEANAEGTSYLGPTPLALLGNFQAASPLVTVTANRSLPGGGATVQWDEEGVPPTEFSVIRDGILVDYQTTREQATWLAPWYAKQGQPVRSHGCAAAPSALDVTLQHTPNLALRPGSDSISFEDLVRDTRTGIAVLDGGVYTDFQSKTGIIDGTVREITNGKLGNVLPVRLSFETTGLWKSLIALGGPESLGRAAARHRKGEPVQTMIGTVEAVPAKFAQVSVIRGNA